MNKDELFRAFGHVDEEILERSEHAGGKTGRLRWGMAAACLLLALGALLWLRGPRIAVKETGSPEEIASLCGGDLLAGRLAASGARALTARLRYVRGGDASDPAAWQALSVTGDYNGRDFTLDCDYSGGEEGGGPAGAYAVTRYGDVEVTIYREESDWSGGELSLYRAVFLLDGVRYSLSTHSGGPEDIYACLDLVLDEFPGGGTRPDAALTDVMGFGLCRVEMEEISPFQHCWHYYVRIDGGDVCVAEQFGYDGPEAWSRDLDGDGVPELICNCAYSDGGQSVIVYRNHGGVIEEGTVRWSYYRETFHWARVGENGLSSFPVERYDPERGVFTAADYDTRGYDDPVTVEFDDGLEPFDFVPFVHRP